MLINISEIQKKYLGTIDHLDLDLIIAHAAKKSREFILTHPEYSLSASEIKNLESYVARRKNDEPLAYILESKDFFGLSFGLSSATLIPRPETELLVDEALDRLKSYADIPVSIIDVGTGSGNIIISLVKNSASNSNSFGVDFSLDALRIAKKNAKKHGASERINFLHGNLLEPFFKDPVRETLHQNFLIIANLPYLSQEIYNSTAPTVKNYEPISALLSLDEGLSHYKGLLTQINDLKIKNGESKITIILEISPEQKIKLPPIIDEIFSKYSIYSIYFKKDLAQRWRLCRIEL